MAFELKVNDRRPTWRVQLTANGEPVDVTGALNIRFTMSTGSPGDPPKVSSEPMDVVEAPNGIVEYAWAAGDTDTAGNYNAEVEVEWEAGVTTTFPSKGYFLISIFEDLD